MTLARRNLIKDYLRERLKKYTTSDFKEGPDKGKNLLFSDRIGKRYLLIVHDSAQYKGDFVDFAKFVDRQGIYCLPIFDDHVFFKRDKSRYRLNPDESRIDLLKLEQSAEKFFNSVVYFTASGLLVVKYGPAYSDYSNIPPRSRLSPLVETVNSVESEGQNSYLRSRLEIQILISVKTIKGSDLFEKFALSPSESPIRTITLTDPDDTPAIDLDLIRGNQLVDISDGSDLTDGDLRLYKIALRENNY